MQPGARSPEFPGMSMFGTALAKRAGRNAESNSRMQKPTTKRRRHAMKTKTHIKAGALTSNHSQTLVQVQGPTASLTVKTRVKAGALTQNHNQTLVRAPQPTPSLTVKTHVKAAGTLNHNQTPARAR